MAERRMFAKTIIDSDAFLEMPMSARLLYYDLSMRADDDGFVNSPKKIMKFIGATNDDMNILIARKFVISFDNGIVVIKHWRIHNYIQKDRYVETKYKEEKAMLGLDENNSYTLGESGLLLENNSTPLTEAQEKRYRAKKESSLPYSFEYKMRNAFVGERCPICNCIMNYSNNLTKPTIQHNVPISKGGKHELDNISIICASCNSSIINHQITPPLNNEKVKEVWKVIGNGSGMDTQVRLGKDSIDKNKEDIYELIQTFKSNLTPTDYEMINEVIDKYTLEQFEEAIEISKSNNAKTIKYLIQVLKNPIRNKKVMKRPKWMDEDLTRKDVKLTDEEQRELDEIIKGS